MFIISIKCVIMSHLAPLSDERAQQIIDKALQESSVDMRNIISVLTGLMGSGKTCLLSRIFNKPPPSVYTSTGIAEKSIRGCLLFTYKFGIILLNDEDGCLLDAIENDCLGKCEHIVRKILFTWIQGTGKPVTWNALIETLRHCSLNKLADQIHKKMQ